MVHPNILAVSRTLRHAFSMLINDDGPPEKAQSRDSFYTAVPNHFRDCHGYEATSTVMKTMPKQPCTLRRHAFEYIQIHSFLL